MTEGIDDKGKRRFLIAATSVVGAVGAGFVAVPFVMSLKPSAKAQAAGAPVEVDISKLEPGEKVIVEWRGKPVWVVRRTEKNLAELKDLDAKLADPNSDVEQQPVYAKNPSRAIKPEYLIVVGICTHLGCSPTHVKENDPASAAFDDDWKGGFFCPCHGSKFDLAGRIYAGLPAPTNLVVPPHTYVNDSRILIGVDQEGAA
ncbi:ubiquinol-cytochrome c reductase iron-sulfur subunit [Candidatus Halobeggiatoa sp. HSG11]|nr:ubiquinol-cytochrome c reductase iron-sulfur subunit [Candidatus Halobeggiatoa sp. HSG11]